MLTNWRKDFIWFILISLFLYSQDPVECRFRVSSLLESNSLIGVRGCRLGIMFPDILRMQIRAFFSKVNFIFQVILYLDAAVDSKLKEKELSFLQIFVPMVSTDHEVFPFIIEYSPP
jgi:hypothetical protein